MMLTNTQRDDIARALETRASSINTWLATHTESLRMQYKFQDELERINNLLQGHFISI